MNNTSDSLGDLLHAWRDRLSPIDAGITAIRGRRTPGLRREELAGLAGLSVVYITRLEQGRAVNPSAQVAGALARALQLSRVERDHLFRAGGLLPPADGQLTSHIPPGVQRLVARLDHTAVAVFRADWQILAWNGAWAALHGDPLMLLPGGLNILEAVFLDGPARNFMRLTESVSDHRSFEQALVADLRVTAAAYSRDIPLRKLIHRLRSGSERFAMIWDVGRVAQHQSDRKTITHPGVGQITLDCDVMTVPGSDLRIVVYSAPSNSTDAEKLDFLRVTGPANLIQSAV